MQTTTHRKELIELMMEGIADSYNKIFVLAAIWLDNPIKTSIESKRRITKGDLVKVQDGQLIDCNGIPTHKIVECRGNTSNTCLKLDLVNLITNEPITIDV